MRDVVLRHAERPAQDQGLEHRRVEPAVGLGHARERPVGDRLVLEGHPIRLAMEAVHVAEGDPAVRVGLERLRVAELLDLEVPHERVADRELLVRVVLQAREQPVRGEDEQPGVRERAEQHQRVVVATLAADLLGVHARGLVAMVAVRDQKLRVGQRALQRGDLVRVGNPPERVAGALVVARFRERPAALHTLEGLAGGAARVGKEAEDGGEVCLRRAREPQAVLLRAGVGALVRTDAARPVILHAHAREETGPAARAPVRCRVVLAQDPESRLVLLGEHAPCDPVAHGRRGSLVAISLVLRRLRQVDLDDVVRAARDEVLAQLGVDHVIGGRDHVLERADGLGVIAKGAQGLDVSHRPATLAGAGPGSGPRLAPQSRVDRRIGGQVAILEAERLESMGLVGVWRNLVARSLWVAEVLGSNPSTPT